MSATPKAMRAALASRVRGRGANWLRTTWAAVVFTAAVAATQAPAQAAGPSATAATSAAFEEGRALYEGRHPGLSATLRGAPSVAVPTAQAACVSCHRPSGLGSFEGEAVVPPISSGLLTRPFDPATTRRYGVTLRPGDEG